jgi:phosphonopyruvate decarboxylase
MINTKHFYNWLTANGVEFFSGVPDSLLKDICAYITDNTPKNNHTIAANEGNAIAMAAGYHLATGKLPMVYMQNSGMGNAINPLLSLTDPKVYSIPVLLMIGWRGEPGLKDEPQHIKQGEVTVKLLEAVDIPYIVLSSDEAVAEKQVKEAIDTAYKNNTPFALVIKKGTFEKYSIKEKIKTDYPLSREDAVKQIVSLIDKKDVIVSTTGKTSRELFEIRENNKQPHHSDFLTVGSMGHTSQIALGIALQKTDRKVICIDGDGAVLMHMGGMAIIGSKQPGNFVHIVINNGAHESVGGQPTVGLNVDMPAIALANNYKSAVKVQTEKELNNALKNISKDNCPCFIEVLVRVGSRDNLGRPTIKPVDNKKDFMKQIQV